MPRLLLVRHGITEFNSARKFVGHSDVELSTIGCRQAERLRDRLVNNKIDAVYSSDLKRAVMTAKIVSSGHEVDIEIYPELKELDYGDIEGLTFEEASLLYPEVAESMANLSLQLKLPGGESFEKFIRRTGKFLNQLKRHTPSQTVLIISHGGPLRALICHLLGIEAGHWRKFRFNNASLTVLETSPRGAILVLLNDTSHLTGVDGSD